MIAEVDFHWCRPDGDETVCIPEQLAIACYLNPSGDIVIRQRADAYEDQDAIVLVAPIHARTLATAILRLLGETLPVTPEASLGDGSVTPAALRQRRYRERHRKEPEENQLPLNGAG
jgi:hypothetical protein